MSFKVGERVRFLNEVGEGRVVEIRTDGICMVEDESGFAMPYPEAELVAFPSSDQESAYKQLDPDLSQVIDRNVPKAKLKKAREDFKLKYKNPKATNVHKRGEQMEVDLHSHEVIENERGLDPAEIRDIQIAHFERMMRRAETQKISRIIFIHGVGQGVLRQAIRNNIDQYYPNASYHDANFQEYGYGATEVILRF